MENVSHTLAGFALARAAPGKTIPLVTTALVGGANLPDIDLAWSSFRSALVYYHYHRGWTHSIPGFLVLTSLWWLTLLADASFVRHGVVGAVPFFDLPGASRAALTRNLDAPAVEALMK